MVFEKIKKFIQHNPLISLYILVNCLIGAVIVFTNLNTPFAVPDLFSGKTEYTITTADNYFANPDLLPIPYPQVPPFSKKYPLILLKEKYDLYKHKHDHYFYAAKRLAELEQWGNTLKIRGDEKYITQPDSSLLSIFLRMLNNQRGLYWETFLGSYKNYINTYISDYITQIEEKKAVTNKEIEALLTMKRQLNFDHQKLLQIIDKSNKTAEEKKYLTNATEKFFSTLNTVIDRHVKPNPPTQAEYFLFPLVNTHDYGIYQPSMNFFDNQPCEDVALDLVYDNKTLARAKALHNDSLPEVAAKTKVFQTITIDEHSRKLDLVQKPSNLTDTLQWEKDPYISTVSAYLMKLPELKKSAKYYFQFKKNSDYELLFMEKTDVPQPTEKVIYSTHESKGFIWTSDRPSRYFIKLISPPSDQNQAKTITLKQVCEPIINMLRVSKLSGKDTKIDKHRSFASTILKVSNISDKEYQLLINELKKNWNIKKTSYEYNLNTHTFTLESISVYYLKTLWLVFNFIIFVIVLVYLFIKSNIRFLTNSIARVFVFCTRYARVLFRYLLIARYIFLILVTVSVVLFLGRALLLIHNRGLIIFSELLPVWWVLFVLAFQIRKKYHFWFFILFLSLTGITLYKNNITGADILADQAHLFLLFGFVHSVIDLCKETEL